MFLYLVDWCTGYIVVDGDSECSFRITTMIAIAPEDIYCADVLGLFGFH